MHKFCERFSNDWSPLKSKDVERCYLQRGEAKWSPIPGTGDRALEITRWVDLQDGEMIDSGPRQGGVDFHGDGKDLQRVPVRFQVERTDGFNVPGPAYNTVARPCSKEDGEAIGVEKGRYVAILDFTYSYRKKQAKNFPEETAKIYHGIKPMVESIAWADVVKTTELAKFSADWVYHKIRPQEMTMAVRYAVGDGNVAGYAGKRRGRSSRPRPRIGWSPTRSPRTTWRKRRCFTRGTTRSSAIAISSNGCARKRRRRR